MYRTELYILIFLLIILVYELIAYFIEGIQLRRLSEQIKREKQRELEEQQARDRVIFDDIFSNGFKVAGISFYKEDIISLLDRLEPDESEYVYDVREDTVRLVPEPTNQYDPNAIAVYMDNVKIGHVPKDLTHYVRIMIDTNLSFIGTITNGDMYDDDGEIIERNFSCVINYGEIYED